ncbi:MAG TPA: DUF1190 domain-containing protein [Methylosinus sp.]|jgi:hypothetical protein|uniref:DUF1190 domain-containing protein n=1 Tax=Methylosinus sp. TaxID=427 RepID=UPI002F921480
MPAAIEAARAETGTSYLFATVDACAASGRFSRRSCETAFANSVVELRERIQNFATRSKCQAKYRLCEKDAGAEEAYRPTLLGVEIMTGGREPSVMPILAVETPPRAFAAQPISRSIEPTHRLAAGFAPILPVGRFHVKAKSAEDSPESVTDDEIVDVDAPTLRDEGEPATRESTAARRQRLRAAPFVQ